MHFQFTKTSERYSTNTHEEKKMKTTHLLMKTEAGCGTDGSSFSWETFCLHPKRSFVHQCEIQITRCLASRAGTWGDKTSWCPLVLKPYSKALPDASTQGVCGGFALHSHTPPAFPTPGFPQRQTHATAGDGEQNKQRRSGGQH